jgi:hypothetical protein
MALRSETAETQHYIRMKMLENIYFLMIVRVSIWKQLVAQSHASIAGCQM